MSWWQHAAASTQRARTQVDRAGQGLVGPRCRQAWQGQHQIGGNGHLASGIVPARTTRRRPHPSRRRRRCCVPLILAGHDPPPPDPFAPPRGPISICPQRSVCVFAAAESTTAAAASAGRRAGLPPAPAGTPSTLGVPLAAICRRMTRKRVARWIETPLASWRSCIGRPERPTGRRCGNDGSGRPPFLSYPHLKPCRRRLPHASLTPPPEPARPAVSSTRRGASAPGGPRFRVNGR